MTHSSDTPRLSRREWMKLAASGVAMTSASGWFESFAAEAAQDKKRQRSVILLWMNGGPSQTDTFDMKPGHKNGGEFKEIQTAAPGLRFSEHLPKLAKHAKELAVIRSMSTKEGDHRLGTYLMRTGRRLQGPIQYPTLGSFVSKELGSNENPLPNFVAIAPYRVFSPQAFGPGFLGPNYAPLIVGDPLQARQQAGQAQAPDYAEILKVQDLNLPLNVDPKHANARIDILKSLERDFVRTHPGVATESHKTAYDRAVKLMKTDAAKAFDLEEEKDQVRDAYGRNLFGQGCLFARRLVERGVPFVEVSLSGTTGNLLGWDTHGQNFPQVKSLCEVLDPAWAMLMTDLKQRGLLDSTLIVWMGEFGRTPVINGGGGRDHYPNAWSTVLAGGGIKGGQAYGKTSADGTTVEENAVDVHDFMATICKAVGLDPTKQNQSNIGRPIRLADPGSTPIKEVLS